MRTIAKGFASNLPKFLSQWKHRIVITSYSIHYTKLYEKAGADAPEVLLAYADIDGTYSAKEPGIQRQGEAATANLKTWQPHVQDWKEGDPSSYNFV